MSKIANLNTITRTFYVKYAFVNGTVSGVGITSITLNSKVTFDRDYTGLKGSIVGAFYKKFQKQTHRAIIIADSVEDLENQIELNKIQRKNNAKKSINVRH